MSTYRFLKCQRGSYALRELCQVGRGPERVLRLAAAPPAAGPGLGAGCVSCLCPPYPARWHPPVQTELQDAGYQIGRRRIRLVLHQHGLRTQQPCSFMPRIADSGHGQRVALNRLLGRPLPTRPDQVWVGDITCLPKQGEGWFYLVSWQDACSRKVVGWDLRETMPEDLVSEALYRALAVRQPTAGLLVHSDDQDSQYTTTRFRDLLADYRTQ